MTEKYYLAIFDADWADEFDVRGIRMMKHDEVDELNDIINKAKFPGTFYFGSNEELEWERKEDVTTNLKYVEISKSTYDEMIKAFNSSEFGHFPPLEDILYNEDDDV